MRNSTVPNKTVRSTMVAAQFHTGAMKLTLYDVNEVVLSPITLIVVHPDAEKRKVTREGFGSDVPVTVMISAPLVVRALDGEVANSRRGTKGIFVAENVGVEPYIDVEP
jgi:hypothetical protein